MGKASCPLASLAIYDTIKNVVPDVRTIGMGLTASGASLILVGGSNTKRFAFPHTRVLIHQPSASRFVGTPREIELEAAEMFKLRDVIADIYSQDTGRPVNEIQNDMERDTYMSATEAQAYGIVDRVIKEKEKKKKK
ncbi:ATP-dependent Clp protease proteolytic subunit [Rhynchospora pubera]|uniref:ATP-dependent Clp protease proteolytic subunit n=1 Tax=Rhynchospora pubera TaxID=906938 RepID=A0AAV8FFP3_9POAL|nr:ATP-dependent Clp protease proteolytic subunit [Rhynchospora pubera]